MSLVYGFLRGVGADGTVVFCPEGRFFGGVWEVSFDVHADFVGRGAAAGGCEAAAFAPVAVMFGCGGGSEVVSSVFVFGDFDVGVDEVLPHLFGFEQELAASVFVSGWFPETACVEATFGIHK